MEKAQSVVPVMIILLAIFAVFYVYLLPLSEKCKLMPDLQECTEKSVEKDRIKERYLAEIKPEILIEEKIGFLPIQQKYAVYSLRPMEMFSIKEIEIATIMEKEKIIRNWFSGDVKKGAFFIHNLSEEIILFLYINQGSGTLKININPKVELLIKEDDLMKDMPIQMHISSENLENMNILRLSVSNPLTPFQKNEYSIEKIIVKEVYRLTDDNIRENIKIKEDMNKLEEAYLYYNPHCLTNEKLSITLNGKEIKKEVLCRDELINITKDIEGDNELIFSTKGNYFISHAKLHLKFEKVNNTKFYFDVKDKEYVGIKKGIALVFLNMNFESTEAKKIDVYINNKLLTINTKDINYETAINKYIENGKNVIELASRTDTKVNLLKIDVR